MQLQCRSGWKRAHHSPFPFIFPPMRYVRNTDASFPGKYQAKRDGEVPMLANTLRSEWTHVHKIPCSHTPKIFLSSPHELSMSQSLIFFLILILLLLTLLSSQCPNFAKIFSQSFLFRTQLGIVLQCRAEQPGGRAGQGSCRHSVTSARETLQHRALVRLILHWLTSPD